jgi:hypothetical protein
VHTDLQDPLPVLPAQLLLPLRQLGVELQALRLALLRPVLAQLGHRDRVRGADPLDGLRHLRRRGSRWLLLAATARPGEARQLLRERCLRRGHPLRHLAIHRELLCLPLLAYGSHQVLLLLGQLLHHVYRHALLRQLLLVTALQRGAALAKPFRCR